MFGKFFASTFTGSMFGAGPDVFALWGYVVATAVAGSVELNPAHLAAVLGCDVGRIRAALDILCAPDTSSRSQAEEGRRLIHESGFSYRVVNHSQYRAIRNEEERRAYNRDAKRRERSKGVKQAVNDKRRKSTLSAHTEAEAEAETEAETDHQRIERADSPDPAKTAGSEPVMVFPLKNGKSWSLTPDAYEALRRDFGVNVKAECHSARAWLVANPGRRKTAKGMLRFLTGWMARVGQGRPAGAIPARPMLSPPEIRDLARSMGGSSWAADCMSLHDGRCGGPAAHRAAMEGA